MSAPFVSPVSALQVGSCFVEQYYSILQYKRNLVYQFYTDASTMLRVDGDRHKSATAMQQIHSLIMSLNFLAIEIKNTHSLESWNGGVLVMATGFVNTKNFSGRRKFTETFFLAPQEKGYFVLNDLFHFVDDEQISQHPTSILANSNFEPTLNAPSPLLEPVSDYMLGGEFQNRDFVVSPHVEENSVVDNYSIPEPPQGPQQAFEVDNRPVLEEAPALDSTASFPVAVSSVRDPPPVPVQEPVGESQKQTYASILRVSKGQQAVPAASQVSLNRSSASVASKWHEPQPVSQQSYPVPTIAEEKFVAEAATEETAPPEEEGEGSSVYVRNLPFTVSEADIEQGFKIFGRIKPEGVVIRNRKDIGVCYAFVEFEDIIGAQSAIKGSPIQLAGQQVYIEERRANSSSVRGGRGRGRGRGRVQPEAPRGRFGSRSFGRESGQDGSDRDYSNRLRGNGFHQRVPRQERGILGSQGARNGATWSDSA